MKKIKEILQRFNKDDYFAVKETIEMLCYKGINNGCYQDYGLLMDVIGLLYACLDAIKTESAKV